MSLLDRLLPPRCVFCLQPADGPRICAGCRADLPALGRACPGCAEPLPSASAGQVCCAHCQRRPPPWSACRAALPYAWPVDSALIRLKFSRELCYAPAFGELLTEIAHGEFRGVDALCPVPLHPRRQFLRGFNQASELCRPLARVTGLPTVGGLRRVRHTAPQSGLDHRQRRRNLAGAFRLRGALRCRHPLIVDDVMTTGETCRQLARVLLAHGAREVGVLVVARAAAPSRAGAPASPRPPQDGARENV